MVTHAQIQSARERAFWILDFGCWIGAGLIAVIVRLRLQESKILNPRSKTMLAMLTPYSAKAQKNRPEYPEERSGRVGKEKDTLQNEAGRLNRLTADGASENRQRSVPVQARKGKKGVNLPGFTGLFARGGRPVATARV
jgi:hypothetical protein